MWVWFGFGRGRWGSGGGGGATRTAIPLHSLANSNAVVMHSNLVDKVFCYPDVIRFSWGPIKDRIEERGVPVVWEDEDEETGQSSMSDFLGNSDGGKRKRQRLGGNKVQKGIERTELF